MECLWRGPGKSSSGGWGCASSNGSRVRRWRWETRPRRGVPARTGSCGSCLTGALALPSSAALRANSGGTRHRCTRAIHQCAGLGVLSTRTALRKHHSPYTPLCVRRDAWIAHEQYSAVWVAYTALAWVVDRLEMARLIDAPAELECSVQGEGCARHFLLPSSDCNFCSLHPCALPRPRDALITPAQIYRHPPWSQACTGFVPRAREAGLLPTLWTHAPHAARMCSLRPNSPRGLRPVWCGTRARASSRRT
jgi:hypothetical protein